MEHAIAFTADHHVAIAAFKANLNSKSIYEALSQQPPVAKPKNGKDEISAIFRHDDNFWIVQYNNAQNATALLNKQVNIGGHLLSVVHIDDMKEHRPAVTAVLRLHRLPPVVDLSFIKSWSQSYKGTTYFSTKPEHFSKHSGMSHIKNGVWRVRLEFPNEATKQSALDHFRGKHTAGGYRFIVNVVGEPPACSGCNAPGHVRSRCPKLNRVCSNCNRQGHTEATCWGSTYASKVAAGVNTAKNDNEIDLAEEPEEPGALIDGQTLDQIAFVAQKENQVPPQNNLVPPTVVTKPFQGIVNVGQTTRVLRTSSSLVQVTDPGLIKTLASKTNASRGTLYSDRLNLNPGNSASDVGGSKRDRSESSPSPDSSLSQQSLPKKLTTANKMPAPQRPSQPPPPAKQH